MNFSKATELGSHCQNSIFNSNTTTNIKHCARFQPPLFPATIPANHKSNLFCLPFWTVFKKGTIRCIWTYFFFYLAYLFEDRHPCSMYYNIVFFIIQLILHFMDVPIFFMHLPVEEHSKYLHFFVIICSVPISSLASLWLDLCFSLFYRNLFLQYYLILFNF